MAVSSEQWRQYVSALCVLCVAVFLGLPTWWRTTEVYRCPLPYREISQLASQQVPPSVVLQISIAVLGRAGKEKEEEEFSSLLQSELRPERFSSGGGWLEISYTVSPLQLGRKERAELAEALQSGGLDESAADSLFPSAIGHYTILLVRGGGGGVFVSPYRYAVVHLSDALPSVLPHVVHLVRSVYDHSQTVRNALRTVSGGEADAESMRQLRATQGYQLSFTLLNPDPSQQHVHWNIDKATEDTLLPFLQHPGIASLGNFTVSSQVFYYTDTKLHPRKWERGYYVTPSSLPPMISSVESKLASHVSQLPSLNFLLYVPREGESPLFIQDGHTSTDAFFVPQWGGVAVFNPPGPWGEGERRMVTVPMEQVMPVFIRQLRMLLGLPAVKPTVMEEFGFSHSHLGISEWQVDQLLVAKMVESVSMATTSLISLVGLLDKVKNMVISDHIQELVVSALDSVHECYRLAGDGRLGEAHAAAKAAMFAAETAFFDPSILELLYFPDDQKFAIYIPLFLPISIPIVLSSLTALKWALASLRTREKVD